MRLPRPVLAASLVLTSTLAVSACGDAPREKKVLPMFAQRCPSLPRTQVIHDAVTEYITTASPTPQLFLYIPATDSSLPDAGVRALQDKGNTFLYSQDPALQQAMRKKLNGIDYYTTMLVTYGGLQQPDSTHAVVRVGGHYVGKKAEKETAGMKEFRFQCDSTAWKLMK